MKLKEYMDISESSLNRVRKAWTDYDTGTITSFRDFEDCGEGAKISKKDKKLRNYDLRAILLSMGYGVTKVKGSWFENGNIEVSEESFFVVDIKNKGNLKKDLITLGGKYDQDSITYAKAGDAFYAISTNTCPRSWPGNGKIGVETKLGSPIFGKSGINGFSRVNNRSFVFEGFQMDKLTDYGLTEWRGITAIYHKYMEVDSPFNRISDND